MLASPLDVAQDVERACGWCGEGFAPKRRDQRTCGAHCRRKLNNAENNPKHYVHHEPRECSQCGVIYRPPRSDSKCCSVRCRRRSHYVPRDRWHDKVCVGCEQPFTSKRSDAVYCGRRCQTAHRYPAVQRGPGVSMRDWQRMVNRYGGRCAYCGFRPRWTPLHMDHVIPLKRGGRHSIGNVLPACGSCNVRKNARLLADWRQESSMRRRRLTLRR